MEVADIVPGSPADKIGRICIGDKIWAINFKRMHGKTLNTLKVVKKLIKVFASSVTVHLISKHFNGKYIFQNIRRGLTILVLRITYLSVLKQLVLK